MPTPKEGIWFQIADANRIFVNKNTWHNFAAGEGVSWAGIFKQPLFRKWNGLLFDKSVHLFGENVNFWTSFSLSQYGKVNRRFYLC